MSSNEPKEFKPGDRVTAAWLQWMLEQIKMFKNLTVGPGLELKKHQNGFGIYLSDNSGKSALVKITGVETGAGLYKARSVFGQHVTGITSAASLPGTLTLSTVDDMVVLYPPDIGTSSHTLNYTTCPWVIGTVVGATTETNPRPIVVVTGAYGNHTATITGHSGITGHVGWTYSATLDDGTSVTLYNDLEPCEGSPGKLGVNVGTDGTVNGGSCHIQPIGNVTIPVRWDTTNNRWAFYVSNGAH